MSNKPDDQRVFAFAQAVTACNTAAALVQEIGEEIIAAEPSPVPSDPRVAFLHEVLEILEGRARAYAMAEDIAKREAAK